MISFYPGPSRIFSEVPRYFKEAYQSGILSINHRSKEFADLYIDVSKLFRKKLNVPAGYQIFFTSSATENWEILAQSATKNSSVHIYNGAFGEKWYKYAKHIHPDCRKFTFDVNHPLKVKEFGIPKNPEMICLTHNETSNGTMLDSKTLGEIRNQFAKSLICLDATSSMGGINLDFKLGDAWFASVQKCFGLPAGLGILVCSPAFIKRTKEIGESGRYNSFSFMLKNSENWQTPFTPNVSSIYLLKRVLENSETIKAVEKKLLMRYKNWIEVLNNLEPFRLYIKSESVRSRTVLTVEGSSKDIERVKAKARTAKFLLGSGYGDLKSSTFRIANFPALTDGEVGALQKFLLKNYS